MDEPIRIDSRAWTGDLAGDPPRDLPAPLDPRTLGDLYRSDRARPGRARTALMLTVLGLIVIAILYSLAWMVCWHAAGRPPILIVPVGWPDVAALAAAALLLLAIRRLYDRPGRIARAVLMFGIVYSIGHLVDFEAADALGPARTIRLFVVGRSDAGIELRRHARKRIQLEPQLETVDSSGLRFWLVVPSSILRKAVAGDTCITVAIPQTNFVNRPLASMRLDSSGDGTGSYLSRDAARRRCLAGAPGF